MSIFRRNSMRRSCGYSVIIRICWAACILLRIRLRIWRSNLMRRCCSRVSGRLIRIWLSVGKLRKIGIISINIPKVKVIMGTRFRNFRILKYQRGRMLKVIWRQVRSYHKVSNHHSRCRFLIQWSSYLKFTVSKLSLRIIPTLILLQPLFQFQFQV